MLILCAQDTVCLYIWFYELRICYGYRVPIATTCYFHRTVLLELGFDLGTPALWLRYQFINLRFITEARNIILTTACHHLRVHLARRDELSQCAEMIADVVALLWKKEELDQNPDPDDFDPDVDVLCLNIFDVLVETVLHLIGGNSPVLVSFLFYNYILGLCMHKQCRHKF